MPIITNYGAIRRDFHVLIVDDDAAEGDLLSGALKEARSNTVVSVVSSPEKAIRFLYRDGEFANAPIPDLVFIDYRMPSNGGRVLSIVKGDPDLRTIPVVVFSVDASAQDIREIYSRHANCCINKSTTMPELTIDLRNALTFWMDVALVQRSLTRASKPSKESSDAP